MICIFNPDWFLIAIIDQLYKLPLLQAICPETAPLVEEAAVDQAVARDATSAAKSAIWPEAASLDQAPGASPDQAGETVVVRQHPERSRLANGYKDFFFKNITSAKGIKRYT